MTDYPWRWHILLTVLDLSWSPEKCVLYISPKWFGYVISSVSFKFLTNTTLSFDSKQLERTLQFIDAFLVMRFGIKISDVDSLSHLRLPNCRNICLNSKYLLEPLSFLSQWKEPLLRCHASFFQLLVVMTLSFYLVDGGDYFSMVLNVCWHNSYFLSFIRRFSHLEVVVGLYLP